MLTDPIDLGYPNVAVAGFDGIGQPTNTPQDHPTYTLHLMDNFAWNPDFNGGRHQFKMGGEFRRYFYNLLFDTTARGVWNFNGSFGLTPLVQLLRGLPSNAQKVDKGVTMDLFQNSYGAYLQDDFRVTDRLTLNLGLRYEFNVPVTEGKNELSVADLTVESASCTPKPGCLFIPAGTRGIPDATYFGDGNNFAPRVGFAWRPTDSENFVIRSGFGIYYDQTLLNAHLNARLNPPFRITQLIVNPGTATINTIFNEAPSQTPPGGSFMNLNYQDPSQHQWNVGTQFAPFSQSVIDVAYVGTRGKDLSRFHRINQPAPGQAPPFPQFQPTLQEIDNTAESKYDALQLKFESRRARDLNMVTSYTWSRCLDNGTFFGSSTSGGTVAQDPRNFDAEWGDCQYNTDHRFVTNVVYRLPFGAGREHLTSGVLSAIFGNWDVSGILTLQSGHPFTVTRGVPQSGTVPVGRLRPARSGRRSVCAGPVAANPTCVAPTEVHTVQNWFNPCAFMAAPGRFGTAPRGAFDGTALRQPRSLAAARDSAGWQRAATAPRVPDLQRVQHAALQPAGRQLRLAGLLARSSRRTPDRRGKCRSASSTVLNARGRPIANGDDGCATTADHVLTTRRRRVHRDGRRRALTTQRQAPAPRRHDRASVRQRLGRQQSHAQRRRGGRRRPREVRRLRDAAVPANAKVIDLSRYYGVPGLIDAHTHITVLGRRDAAARVSVRTQTSMATAHGRPRVHGAGERAQVARGGLHHRPRSRRAGVRRPRHA